MGRRDLRLPGLREELTGLLKASCGDRGLRPFNESAGRRIVGIECCRLRLHPLIVIGYPIKRLGKPFRRRILFPDNAEQRLRGVLGDAEPLAQINYRGRQRSRRTPRCRFGQLLHLCRRQAKSDWTVGDGLRRDTARRFDPCLCGDGRWRACHKGKQSPAKE